MMIRAAEVRKGSWLVNQVEGGNRKVPAKDPAETRCDILTVIRNAVKAQRQAHGAAGNNDPMAVATPFPLGLNLR